LPRVPELNGTLVYYKSPPLYKCFPLSFFRTINSEAVSLYHTGEGLHSRLGDRTRVQN
jgi:hypothetical protein